MKKICFVLFLMILILSVSAQEIKQMEFVNQSIKAILFTLAQTTGTSIIADDTMEIQNTTPTTGWETFLPQSNPSPELEYAYDPLVSLHGQNLFC